MKKSGQLTLIILSFIIPILAHGQVPIIFSVDPAKGAVGTAVSISGSNFSSTPADNIVYFGATRAVVSTASATQLSVVVPKGATFQPITVTVSGLTAYSASPFVVTFSSNYIIDESTFAEKVDFATNTTSPIEIGGGDFDGDGKIDLLFIDNLSEAFSVMKNKGSAGAITANLFEQKIDFTTGSVPQGYAISDLDGDGKLDIAAVHNGTTILVFRNTSTSGVVDASSFTLDFEYLVGFNIALRGIAVADLDGDGKADLVITDQWTTNRILVLKNTSTIGVIDNQSFAAPVDFSTGVSPMAVALADIDGDGKSDIIVSNNGGVAAEGSTISVFKNTTTTGVIDGSSFATKVDFTTGRYPSGLAVGDIDGDHKPDIAVTNYSSASISVFKNQATVGVIDQNSFLSQINFATGTGPYGIAMGDLDGDGKLDLAVTNANSVAGGDLTRTISIFKNTTTTTAINSNSFAAKVDFKTGASPMGIFMGDMDGDNKPDLSVVNNKSFTISMLRNKDAQTITGFDEIAAKKFGDPSFDVSALATSGLPVKFTTASDRVTITGNQVTIVKPGSVTITAEQAGNNFFSAAPKVTKTFCINPVKPTIARNETNVAKPVLTSSNATGNQWYVDGNLIDGADSTSFVVTDIGAYTVKVTTEGCSTMSNGESIAVRDQTINFSSIADKKIGGDSFELSATSSSGLPVQFTTTSEKITITGKQVSIVKPGSVTINAEQAGSKLIRATKVTRTFCVNPSMPSITVDETNIAQPVLTSSGESNNQWYLNEKLMEGATAKTFTVKEKGVYTVKVTIDVCPSPLSEGKVFLVTGDDEAVGLNRVQIYPNPVSDILTIQLKGFSENDNVGVVLVDGIGKTIASEIGRGNQALSIDVKDFANGPYYILMTQGSTRHDGKFIKK